MALVKPTLRPMSDETLVARILLRNQCCAAKVARLSWKDASGSTVPCCAAKFKVAHCSNPDNILDKLTHLNIYKSPGPDGFHP